MFYLGETLTADDAKQYGLVTKIINEDFSSGLMNYWKNIGGSEYSVQVRFQNIIHLLPIRIVFRDTFCTKYQSIIK